MKRINYLCELNQAPNSQSTSMCFTIIEHMFYNCLNAFVENPLMTISCIFIPHFALKCEWLRKYALRDRPTLIVETRGNRNIVRDWFPDHLGIQNGMKLQETLTKINDPHILPWDVDYYELCFQNIINFLHQVSTAVEYVRPGLVYFDLASLYYTYRTDEEIIGFLESEVSRFWKVNIGIGNSKLSSYIGALIGPSAHIGKEFSVTDLQWKKLSIDLLPISLGNKVRLHQFALHTFGDILSLDIGSLQAQFGCDGKLIWELVSDVCTEFLNPTSTEESLHEKFSFQDPVVSLDVIITVAELLLDRGLSRIKSFGLMPRIVSISTEGFNGRSWIKKYSFKEPTADKKRIFSRIRSSLEGVSLSEPLESIKLILEKFTGERGFQGSMLPQVRKHDHLKESIRQLKANFIEDVPIFRIKEVEPWSRIPEERYALVQYVP